MEQLERPPYPALIASLSAIEANARVVAALCGSRGIELMGVVKGMGARPEAARAMLKGGCSSLGSSRVMQLKALREAGFDCPLVLLRVPGPSELPLALRWADRSLFSDLGTLRLAAELAEGAGRRHGVVLMQDLGDLREGWMDEKELVAAAVELERSMPSLELLGIGTNLGCYGAIRPSPANLGALAASARAVEDAIGRPLAIVSGGATSSLPLLAGGSMPRGITELRVGEGILTARDLATYYRCELAGIEPLALRLRLEVLEVRVKPSHPIGEILVDAYGETPDYVDRGRRLRALLGAGKRDFGKHEALIPLEPGMELVGSSSDHLIVDLTECGRSFKPGDLVDFGLFYVGMLYASDCPDLRVEFVP